MREWSSSLRDESRSFPNVGEAFRPPAGDLKVAPTSHVPFEAFYGTMSNYFVHDPKTGTSD